jgi:hypothetical protein
MEYNINETKKEEEKEDKYNIFKINSDTLVLKKKRLIEISKNLTKIEYLEIFNILQDDNCNFSENKNGVFINLLNVTENTIDRIFSFVDFIKHKREDLLQHEEFLENAKKTIKESNIEKYDNNINNNTIEDMSNIDYENTYEDEDFDDNNEKNKTYLNFSSDEDEDIENKLSLKKKKIKYTGKKAKMIKSIKDSNDPHKLKLKNKKVDE